MSIRTTTARGVAGIAGLILTLLLTGCFDRGGEPTPGPSQTVTATATPSDTPTGATGPAVSATPTATAGGSTEPESSPDPAEAAGDLPSPNLEVTGYEGEPRRLEDIYHMECIHALDGEDVPDWDDAAVARDEKPVWSVQRIQALTEGWKNCPTQMYGSIAIPSVFSVEASPGGGSIERLRIVDAAGRQVGGVGIRVTAAAPDGAEVVEVVEVSEARSSPAYGEEIPYLRSLVVQTGSGYQLLVDLVSAPAGADPQTLEVWDLAVGSTRDLAYASIPLDSPEDADAAADSDLHAVLRSMVGSYTVPVH